MKATITEYGRNTGFLGQGGIVKLVGFLKTGEQCTLIIEDDCVLSDSIIERLGSSSDIELSISIFNKQTTITQNKLI